MAIFTLAVLHLSTNTKTDKSMEKFGVRWTNYRARLEANWHRVVSDEDYVICPGDISWATTLEESVSDFAFLDSLPGKKLIGKGNHDFWWNTAAKMNRFFCEHGFTSLSILYNNAYLLPGAVVCGTRGWFSDKKIQNTVGEVDFDKMVARETGRLRLSLDAAKQLQNAHAAESGKKLPICAFLHFPPVWMEFVSVPFLELLREYDVRVCAFGHIHNVTVLPPEVTAAAPPQFLFCAADYLEFLPKLIALPPQDP